MFKDDEIKICGKNACIALWKKSPDYIVKVYLVEALTKEFKEFLKWCSARKIAYKVVENSDLEKLTSSTHHEGICVLAIEHYEVSEEEILSLLENDSCVLYLDSIENPYNMAAIIRSASHFGIKAILVTFIGDHGYHLGEHGLFGKTSNFEYDAGVPFFLSAPGGKHAGTRTRSLAELLDLFPTLVELCALPPPAGLEGTSLVPVLNDPTKSVKAGAFTQHPRPADYDREPDKQPQTMGVSVRTDAVRYTEWRDWKTGATRARELYDNAQEPAELHNRVDDPNFATARQTAEALLRKQFPPVRH